MIMACSDLQSWSTFCQKCGLVPCVNSLDAELGGQWMTIVCAIKSVIFLIVVVVSLLCNAFFVGMRRTRG